VPFTAALSVCVLPFLIGDAIKIVLAAVIAPTIRRTLKKRRG
jgi:biotin transporter BioY